MELKSPRPTARRSAAAVRRPTDAVRAGADGDAGWYRFVARAGLVAKGISYGIVGALAVDVAVGHGGKATSRQGALQTLAQNAFGKVLLILLAVGFACYAAWRFVQAVAERDDDGSEKSKAKAWGKRAGYVGRGLIYAGLTFSTIEILVGAGQQQSQNQKAQHTTAVVLGWPAGRWLVGIAGVLIAGVGLWNLYRGIARTFEDHWRVGSMTETERTWGGRAGVAGHVARFVVFGLVGVFAAKAAIEYDRRTRSGSTARCRSSRTRATARTCSD